MKRKSTLRRTVTVGLGGVLAFQAIAPVVANASVFETGVTNMKEVSNNSGSTAEKPLRLNGGEKDVEFKLHMKELASINIAGIPNMYAVLEIPEEMKGLVTPNGPVRLDATVSVDWTQNEATKGIAEEFKKITGETDSIRKNLKDIMNQVNKDVVHVNVNIQEILQELDAIDNLLSTGKADFDLDEATVSKDGKYLYVKVDKGASEILGRSAARKIKGVRDAINSIEVTPTRDFNEDRADIINKSIKPIKENADRSLGGMEKIAIGIGEMVAPMGSFKLLGNSTVYMPTKVKDPLVHAKDANGKNLFLPEGYEDLLDESLTGRQTDYNAEFAGAFEQNNLIDIHLDLEKLIGEEYHDVIKSDRLTNIYFNYNARKYTKRIAGQTRYATAADVSKKAYKSAKTVILATGQSYPDVAPASTLSAALKSPLLLTEKDVLPNSTLNEIKRLGAENIIIIGGDSSVSKKVEDKLGDYSVRRITGGDRYETAANIAKEVRDANGDSSSEAIVVNGDTFADGIAMATVANQKKAPLLFTESKTLPDATIKALDKFKTKKVFVGGGENSVSKGVLNAMEVDSVERVAGANRYETATKAAALSYPDAEYAVVTDGVGFVDALIAAPYSANTASPVLLATKDAVPGATISYLNNSKIKSTTIIGGPLSISDSVMNTINDLLELK
ncbi:MAG: cell wall-binding repeat-containing protein [Peptostreptococcus sp.]|uniref:cell wall-binding repeat-containing protein n=1 Tax=Peptostreptococcus sp. TaxID=1262 RepID=UPI002FCB8E49